MPNLRRAGAHALDALQLGHSPAEAIPARVPRSARRSNRCPRCLLAIAGCLCSEIPTVQTDTRIIFLRGNFERKSSSFWDGMKPASPLARRMPALALQNYRIGRLNAMWLSSSYRIRKQREFAGPSPTSGQ